MSSQTSTNIKFLNSEKRSGSWANLTQFRCRALDSSPTYPSFIWCLSAKTTFCLSLYSPDVELRSLVGGWDGGGTAGAVWPAACSSIP
jgi:hypothetical protein